jgi:hypothetical protein
MLLFILLNYNMNMTTSYVIFQSAPEEVQQGFWAPDRILLVGVLAFITLIILAYVVFREKGLV